MNVRPFRQERNRYGHAPTESLFNSLKRVVHSVRYAIRAQVFRKYNLS